MVFKKYNKRSIALRVEIFRTYGVKKNYMKRIVIIFLVLSVTACGNKKADMKELFTVEDNIDLALKSNNPDFVILVIDQITTMEIKFPKHQNLKEKKSVLQIRLQDYDNAIITLDHLIKLRENDINNRVTKGILLEIVKQKSESIKVLEEALENIEAKIKRGVRNDPKKKLGLDINRVMILKLLERDTYSDYDQIKIDPDLAKHPEILKLLLLLEDGSREQIISKYR